METQSFTATEYEYMSDLAYHLRAVRRALDGIETEVEMASDHKDNDGIVSQSQRTADALWCVAQADLLANCALAVQRYTVGLARFEHATWQEIGDELDVTKQAVSERYRAMSGVQRGDVTGVLTTGM